MIVSENGERSAVLEEAFRAIVKSVDLMRLDLHELLVETRKLSQRVIVLEVAAARAAWWNGVLVKAVLPVMMTLIGLGIGAYITRVASGS